MGAMGSITHTTCPSGTLVVREHNEHRYTNGQRPADPTPLSCTHPELTAIVEEHLKGGWTGSAGKGNAAILAVTVRDHISCCEYCKNIAKNTRPVASA